MRGIQQKQKTTSTIKNFEYIGTKNTNFYPFRVGDIVKINNWGCSYTTYKDAFIHFTNKDNPPYYSSFLNWQDEEDARKNASEFKIIGVAEHSSVNGQVIAYIQDRMYRGQVIGLKGLQLVKQMPLRIGEKTTIKLKKIKNNNI